MTPAGGLPVLLWAFAALGMLWADVEWHERIAGLGAFHKLLVIPLLLAQFRRSARAHWVVLGFFASSALLLALSWALTLLPGLPWRGKTAVGVPFKDYIAQSGIFALCALGLLGQATEFWRQHRVQHALVLAAVAALFVANILYVATGRTTLVVVASLDSCCWRFGGSAARARSWCAFSAACWRAWRGRRRPICGCGSIS